MDRIATKYKRLRIKALVVLLLLIYIFAFVSKAYAKTDLEMNFDLIRCDVEDPEGIVANFTCFVSKNAKRRTITVIHKFNKRVDKFFIDICIELPRKSADSVVLLNLTNTDGCKMIGNRNQLTLLKIALASLNRYSNYPKLCPFLKDTVYYIRGYRMDMSRFPAFSFETGFRVAWNFVTGGNKILRGLIEAHAHYKNSKKLFSKL